MKRRLELSIALIASMSAAHAEWHHELLNSLPAMDINYTTSAVNRNGVAMYTGEDPLTGMLHVYRQSTDLNKLYISEPSHGIGGYINASGQVLYYALTANSYHLMVDGRDYLTERYGQTSTVFGDWIGLDAAGRPFWAALSSGTNPVRMFRGQEELSAGMQVQSYSGWNMNERGDCLWSGHTAADPSTLRNDLYLNGDNISKGVLGGVDDVITRAWVNDAGEVLWAGLSSATVGKGRLFLGETDITPAGLSYLGIKAWFRSNSGHNVWTYTLAQNHVVLMEDNQDLSTGAFGSDPYTVQAYDNPGGLYLSESGHVGWMAVDIATGRWAAFRDKADLSGAALGQYKPGTDVLDVRGVDDAGNVLWSGSGGNTDHKRDVFVNGFDLTADLYPDRASYNRSYAMAMGPGGCVLWTVDDGAAMRVYLSTPVPEPNVWLLGIPVIGLVGRRTLRSR